MTGVLAELLWMLLPVAAASGWFAARRSEADRRRRAGKRIALEHIPGLEHLLHDQPDTAIEMLLRALEVQPDTLETHLALGSLFRRRGEVDRAIRIHENIINRRELEPEQRSLALCELGLDYMRSGLLDRAEEIFKDLIAQGQYRTTALRYLIEIYQQEQDWQKAISAASELQLMTGEATGYIVAQFLCELAEQELAEGLVNQAKRTLKRALLADAGCVRASLIEARVLVEAGEHREALRPLRRIERQDMSFLSEALPLLARVHDALGLQDEFERYLGTLSGSPAGVPAALMLAEMRAARHGPEAALHCLTTELTTRPSLRGVNQLLRYALPAVDAGPVEALRQVLEQTSALVRKRHGYRCGRCGFRARTLHWLCPSCKRWNEVKPRHGSDND
jgi:lipopolysaccharide assembly protein B